MEDRIFRDIERTILEAINKTENALRRAEVLVYACEDETSETQALVNKAEEAWEVNKTEEAGVALDQAYDIHDRAMRERYNAQEDFEALKEILEALNKATWYC